MDLSKYIKLEKWLDDQVWLDVESWLEVTTYKLPWYLRYLGFNIKSYVYHEVHLCWFNIIIKRYKV